MLIVTAQRQHEALCPRRSTQAPAHNSCASCGGSREGQGLQLRLQSPARHQAIKLAEGKLTEECATGPGRHGKHPFVPALARSASRTRARL